MMMTPRLASAVETRLMELAASNPYDADSLDASQRRDALIRTVELTSDERDARRRVADATVGSLAQTLMFY